MILPIRTFLSGRARAFPVLIAGFLCFVQQPADARTETCFSPDNLCGIHSLFQACFLLGVSRSFEEIMEVLPTPKEEGTSMLTLKEAAETLGLKARGYRMTYDRFLASGTIGIAIVHGNHFVVLSDPSPSGVTIHDVPREVITVPPDILSDIWDGEIILLWRLPPADLDSAEYPRPAVHVERPFHDLGLLGRNRDYSAIFNVCNIGNAPLELSDINPFPRATATLLTAPNVEPGLCARIELSFRTDYPRYWMFNGLEIGTNDPDIPVIRLGASGIFESETSWYPEFLNFGKVSHGESPTRQIRIRPGTASRFHPLQVTDIHASSPSIRVSTETVTLSGSLIPEREEVLTVLLNSGMAPIGPIEEYILVHYQSIEDSSFEIRVTGEVSHPLQIRPPMQYLGTDLRLGKPIARTVYARSPEKSGDISITSVWADDGIEAEIGSEETFGVHSFRITVIPTRPGLLRKNVYVQTDYKQHPLVTIPVIGFVPSEPENTKP